MAFFLRQLTRNEHDYMKGFQPFFGIGVGRKTRLQSRFTRNWGMREQTWYHLKKDIYGKLTYAYVDVCDLSLILGVGRQDITGQ